MKVEFDDALNNAGWTMLTELIDLGVGNTPELFNGLKTSLRKVIQQYVDEQNLEVKQ